MFLWTKIMFEASFHDGITVLGALLIAILFGIYVFTFSGVMALLFLPINMSPGRIETDPWTLFGRSIGPFVIATVFFGIAARLVIVWFSESLSGSLNHWFDWRGWPTYEAAYFLLIVGLPCLIHYILVLVGTFNNCKRTS